MLMFRGPPFVRLGVVQVQRKTGNVSNANHHAHTASALVHSTKLRALAKVECTLWVKERCGCAVTCEAADVGTGTAGGGISGTEDSGAGARGAGANGLWNVDVEALDKGPEAVDAT